MKTKHKLFILSICLMALALAGCQALPTPQSAAAQPAPATATATATTLPRPTLLPTATARPTAEPGAKPAEAAKIYAAALEKGDFSGAAKMLSEFGLTYAGLTRGEAAGGLETAAGIGTASYTLLETKLLDETTALVGVRISPKDGSAAREETWVFRQENGEWLYNYDNLIDTRTLDVGPQTTGGATLKPRILVRYSDHIRLELLAQNATNDVLIFGQENETLAAFHFGSETVKAEQIRIVLEPQRSYPAIAIEVKGSFSAFPNSVDIRIWKDYKVDPWYRFDLTR